MVPTDELARIAFSVSNAKTVAVTVGVVLLIGAVVAKLGCAKPRPGRLSNLEAGVKKRTQSKA